MVNFLVTIFDELFRSENVKQVYGIVTGNFGRKGTA